jgi:hypothetical protein
MKLSKITIYIIFLLSSCITPFDISTTYHETLAVSGLITDQKGPYLVKILKGIPVNGYEQFEERAFESGAMVIIQDDQGNKEALEEKSSGNYYTSFFQGVVGRTYSITITTKDGSTYQSTPEKMMPVGNIKNLRHEFFQTEPPPPLIIKGEFVDASYDDSQIKSVNGFKVYLDSEVLPEQEGRVWWKWTGTFKIKTYPENQVEILSSGGGLAPAGPVSNAPPCSGYDVLNRHTPQATRIGPFRPCTCCICWVEEYNADPLISDQKFVNNQEINKLHIGFIEANRRTFYEKYHLEVVQLSVSQTIYNFWKNVKEQKSNSNDLFQTPPPKTGGNISAITANSIPVIGYFAASAVKTQSLTISRSDVPYDVGIIDTLNVSCERAYPCCRTNYKYSTNVKPVFW